jgi:nucleoside-diphosphate-sugar epimerase
MLGTGSFNTATCEDSGQNAVAGSGAFLGRFSQLTFLSAPLTIDLPTATALRRKNLTREHRFLPMTINLVTGASGFIGGHLVRSLVEQGQQVRCLIRSTSKTDHLQGLDVEYVVGDVMQADSVAKAVTGVDRVYHAAGVVSALLGKTMMQVNTHGTHTVARACANQTSPPVLVVVSSIAASGPTERGKVKTESEPSVPVSEYGRSKRGGEVAAEMLAGQVPITVVRPGIVFGPGDRLLLPAFRAVRSMRVHVVPGMRPPPLSYVYVEDLVKLLGNAARSGRRLPAERQRHNGDGYYFACAPEYPNYSEFGRMLREAVGRRFAPIVHLPEPLPTLFASLQEVAARVTGTAQPLNRDKIREALVQSWACSGAAAARDIGFHPTKSLAERVRTTAQWYIDHGWL